MRHRAPKFSRRAMLAGGAGAVASVAAAEERCGGGPGHPIQGIDVSRWQGQVDFARVAAYHFGRPGSDATRQADFVFDTVRPVTDDLPIVLDLEKDDGQPPAAVRAWTEAFVTRLRERLGSPPIIYTGFYFWRDEAGNGDALEALRLTT